MTGAELQAIEARAVAVGRMRTRDGLDLATPIVRQDVPALVAALRELRAAARTLTEYDGGHGPDCPLSWATYSARAVCTCGYEAAVAALAALVGEGEPA